MITIGQIRAGRAWLNLSQRELALAASISTGTLNNIERGMQTDPKISTLKAIQRALEAQGIKFTENEKGEFGLLFVTANLKPDRPTILIIDDSLADRTLYKAWLSGPLGGNYKIIEADNGIAGAEILVQHNPACTILDFMMYGKDGFQMLVEMKQQETKIPPIIFVTAMQHDTLESDVKSLGVNLFIDKKTLTEMALNDAVEKILNKKWKP